MSFLKLSRYLFFLCFTAFFIPTNAQERHTITLTCQSSELTEQNVNDVCKFDRTSSVPNKEYLTEVQVSDVVLWNAKYAEADLGYVDVVSIDYDSGVNVFKDRHILDTDDGLPNGTIVAIVKKGEAGEELKYTIAFDAYNRSGDFVGRFKIDPKIKVKQLSMQSGIERN